MCVWMWHVQLVERCSGGGGGGGRPAPTGLTIDDFRTGSALHLQHRVCRRNSGDCRRSRRHCCGPVPPSPLATVIAGWYASERSLPMRKLPVGCRMLILKASACLQCLPSSHFRLASINSRMGWLNVLAKVSAAVSRRRLSASLPDAVPMGCCHAQHRGPGPSCSCPSTSRQPPPLATTRRRHRHRRRPVG